MAYSPIDIFDAKVQIDNDRARERKAASQKAAAHKASLSRATAAAASTSSSTSSPQGHAGRSQFNASPSSGRAWRRASHPPSSARPSSSSSAAAMSRSVHQFDMSHVDQDFEDLSFSHEDSSEDEDDDDDSASETEHDAAAAPTGSRMTTLYDSLAAWPRLSRELSIARSSPSPPKHDSPLLSQASETLESTAPLCAERAFDGPGLGLNDNRHWLEAEEEGFACWTAYADDESTSTSSNVIVVRECRW